jgi:Na+/H+-dicarboxylate symporter
VSESAEKPETPETPKTPEASDPTPASPKPEASAAADAPADAPPSTEDPSGGGQGGGDAPPLAPPGAGDGHDKTFLGIKLHNLIFVGMVLGVIMGLITYSLPHHDVLVLNQANAQGETEIVGSVHLVKTEKLYVLLTPKGTEERVPVAQVKEVRRANETGGGMWHQRLIWWFNLFGRTLFLSALKMIIAPLILCSIVAGIVSLTGLDQLRRIGFKTIGYYVCTTLIAVTIGLIMVSVLRPGHKEASQAVRAQRVSELKIREQEYRTLKEADPYEADGKTATSKYRDWLDDVEARKAGTGHEAGRSKKLAAAQGQDAGDILVNGLIKPMLTNPFYSLANSKSLGIIFFAVLLGVAIVIVGGRARVVADFFIGFNDVIIWITTWLMKFAPFCVMCLVAALVGEKGPDIFGTLAWYCAAVIGGIFAHVGVLFAIAHFIGGCSPLRLWSGLREALMIAFTTRSSAATLPVTMRCVIEKLKVSPRVANFALPVGATMNMDGTALYEGVAVIFLIQIFGGLVDAPFELTAAVTLVIFITAVMASIGAAAVPDAGLVTMVLVAEAVHLPVYYIPLIFAVDAFLDMFRTTTNVLGDSVGSLVVHRLEEGAPAGA